MDYTLVVASLTVCFAVAYAVSAYRQQQSRQLLIAQHGCKPPLCLPNKWFPPLGLDKLDKVVAAEKTRTYPLLMLSEHERYGDTYTQYGGGVFTVITRDPRNIREVLSRQFKNFDIGYARHGCVMPLLGDGIFTQDGEKWSHSRKLLAPLVQRPTLPDLQLIERHFQRLLKKIQHNGQAAMDMKEPLYNLSLELTTEFLLGEVPQDGESASWLGSLVEELNTAFSWIATRERLKVFYWLVDGLSFRRSCSAARRIVAELVAKSTRDLAVAEKKEDSYVAFAPLLQPGTDPKSIRDQVLNLVLAGRDTSGALLCWLFYVLGRDSSLVKTLRQEILQQLGTDRVPTRAELNSMRKLDNFVTETLRFFPPVPINGRLSNADTVLPHGGGDDRESSFFVPKGSIVAFSAFALQRSHSMYGPDAGAFNIDRWDNDQVKERRMIDWSYQPFIGGPRKCIGERLAITQAKYLTCRMLQHFDQVIATDKLGQPVPHRDDGSWVNHVKYNVGLTMSPDDGTWVQFVHS